MIDHTRDVIPVSASDIDIGLTLRDLFAALAMSALASNFMAARMMVAEELADDAMKDLTSTAYWIADSMLAERKIS